MTHAVPAIPAHKKRKELEKSSQDRDGRSRHLRLESCALADAFCAFPKPTGRHGFSRPFIKAARALVMQDEREQGTGTGKSFHIGRFRWNSLFWGSLAMEFTDRVLTCIDCGAEFIFTAGEQVFFHDKQFKNDPKRCKQCKAKRVRGSQRVRPETRTTCSECGTETTVPFKPTQGRPVLCRSCFQKVGKVSATSEVQT